MGESSQDPKREAKQDGRQQRESLVVHLIRVVDAPAAVVYNACTDPSVLAKWWGPKGFTNPRVDLDLRPGGKYIISMQPPEGEAFDLLGEFLVVDPPSRLAYTFRWGEPDPEDVETVVTLTFRERGVAATELEVAHSGFATERRRALHDAGWTDTLDRLQAVLSGRLVD